MFLIDTILSLLWWRGSGNEIVVCPFSPWEAEITF